VVEKGSKWMSDVSCGVERALRKSEGNRMKEGVGRSKERYRVERMLAND